MRATYFLALLATMPFSAGASLANAAVVINEFMYDDTGAADDREFVELHNDGASAVNIGDWTVGGRDATTTNTTITIPTGTMLAAGGYYVIGNTGTLNVNQTATAGFLENDNETIELRSGPFATGALVDAVAYETNKGVAFAAPVSGQVGPGVFSNSQGADLAGTPLNATTSVGRFVNGRDTNNNGRDFGLRPSTPGSTNAPGGTMTHYVPPDPSSLSVGSSAPGLTGSFVNAKVIDPTIAGGDNPNAISAPPIGGKAYIAWDPSGGGNSVTSNAVFNTADSGFAISAYFDTRDLPVQATSLRGSELTIYGIGSGDALTNLTDLGGDLGLPPSTLPLSESANGTTGVAWVYEKAAAATAGGSVSEKLYLVDANDGGDSDVGGNTPLDWIILASFDLSGTPSGWFNLSIDVNATGTAGVAQFGSNIVPFILTAGLNSGAFNVGYRENLQLGTDGTPDALMRPPTFAAIPESSWIAALGATLCAAAGVWTGRRRRALGA